MIARALHHAPRILGRLSSSALSRPTRSFASFAPVQAARRTLSDLPLKSELEVSTRGRLRTQRCRSVEQRAGSSSGGTYSLAWVSQPHSVLFVVKRESDRAFLAATKILQFILESRPELSIIVENGFYAQLPEGLRLADAIVVLQPDDVKRLPDCIDFVIALGGDGTLLRVAALFDASPVPPVLGVSMGSLGFLMPIHLDSFPEVLDAALESRAEMLLRMRLQCVVTEDGEPVPWEGKDLDTVHAMNEVTLHRGASPHLIKIMTSIDNQELTEVVADGLLLSTPTGSTAYSLSAGGPIVHPSVPSIGLTAISPRSLSFRSVLLPSDVCVSLSLSPRSRTHASLSLDGHEVRTLRHSQSLNVSMSPFPVPCINGLPVSEGKAKKHDEWVVDIRRMLRFNAPFAEGRGVGDADA